MSSMEISPASRLRHGIYRQWSSWSCGPAVLLTVLRELDLPLPSPERAELLLKTTRRSGTHSSDYVELAAAIAQAHGLRFLAGEGGSIADLTALRRSQMLPVVAYQQPTTGIGHFGVFLGQHAGGDVVIACPDHARYEVIMEKDFIWSTGFEIPKRRGWFVALGKSTKPQSPTS